MPKPYPGDRRQIYKGTPSGVMGIIWVAFGIALLLGLASGIVWILYNLL
jgi:hypothetical protein